jgi:hypothetical protein
VDGDPEALLALLVDPAAAQAVVCSHGELIGTVLERLVGRGLDVGGQLIWPKGCAWVLEVTAAGSSTAATSRRCASKTPRPATTSGRNTATPSHHHTVAPAPSPTPGLLGCARRLRPLRQQARRQPVSYLIQIWLRHASQ